MGDPLLSQTRQLPHPLSQSSLRKAQWFDLCPMTDLFFKETVEVVKEIAPAWHPWDIVMFYTSIKVLTYHYRTWTRYILYQYGVLNDSCDGLW